MSLKIVVPTQRIGNMKELSVLIITDTFDTHHYFYVDKDDLKELTKLVCKRR